MSDVIYGAVWTTRSFNKGEECIRYEVLPKNATHVVLSLAALMHDGRNYDLSTDRVLTIGTYRLDMFRFDHDTMSFHCRIINPEWET